MAKVIYVFDDMPFNCQVCPILYCKQEAFASVTQRSPDCQLKEMPKRKGYDGTSIDSWEGGYRAGWNACLDKIGGTDERQET